jgi:integrase
VTILDAKTVAAQDGTDEFIFDSEPTLRGFAIRVRHDHSGRLRKTWIMQYRFTDDDRKVIQRRQKLGEFPSMSAEKARKKASDWRGKIDRGIDPAGEREVERVATALTFSVAVVQYLAKQQEKGLRGETLRLSKLYLTGKYFARLHRKPVSKITQSDVNHCLDDISSAPTAVMAHKRLSAFFTWCMKRQHCSVHPCLNSDLPENNKPRERVLSDAELRIVWDCCRDDDYGRIIKLLILSGCRADEVGCARWSWINLDEGTISIPAEVDDGRTFEGTKNHKQHVVPITDLMRSIIESIPRRVNRDYLFGSRADGFTSWNKAKLALGDGIAEPWIVHDLRRTFRTGLGRFKIPPHVAELCINHKKKGLVAVYDQYDYAGEIAAAFAMWSDHVHSIVTGTERKVVPLRA